MRDSYWGEDLEKGKGREGGERGQDYREEIRNWVFRVCPLLFGGRERKKKG